MYDGNSVIVDEPVPVKERYEVVVTFIESIGYEKKQNTTTARERRLLIF
jgi:hypothetical protein